MIILEYYLAKILQHFRSRSRAYMYKNSGLNRCISVLCILNTHTYNILPDQSRDKPFTFYKNLNGTFFTLLLVTEYIYVGINIHPHF